MNVKIRIYNSEVEKNSLSVVDRNAQFSSIQEAIDYLVSAKEEIENKARFSEIDNEIERLQQEGRKLFEELDSRLDALFSEKQKLLTGLV